MTKEPVFISEIAFDSANWMSIVDQGITASSHIANAVFPVRNYSTGTRHFQNRMKSFVLETNVIARNAFQGNYSLIVVFKTNAGLI